MKFVKAKESMVATTNADKVNLKKKKNETDQRFRRSNLRVIENHS